MQKTRICVARKTTAYLQRVCQFTNLGIVQNFSYVGGGPFALGAPVSNKVSEGGGLPKFYGHSEGGGIHFTTHRNAASLAIRGLLV